MAGNTHRAPELHDRSVGELLKQLSEETTMLVRQELELAKAEMTEKGKKAGLGLGMFGGAGAIGLLALGSLTACVIAALDTAMALWLACLIVAIAYAAAAGILAMTGKERIKESAPPLPEKARTSVKEDLEWAKTRARSART